MYFASADSNIHLHDVISGKELMLLKGHKDRVLSLALSTFKQVLASLCCAVCVVL